MGFAGVIVGLSLKLRWWLEHGRHKEKSRFGTVTLTLQSFACQLVTELLSCQFSQLETIYRSIRRYIPN